MLVIRESLIENIGEKYIKTYLNDDKNTRLKEQEGIKIVDWINKLLLEERINVKNFEDFVFHELFFGRRKQIRVYQLDSITKIKYYSDWEKIFKTEYKINQLEFNSILTTWVTSRDTKKISAVHVEENEKGELVKLQILFNCYICLEEESEYRDSCAYIPVEIDFLKKIMIIKAWNRNNVAPAYRSDLLIESVVKILAYTFHVKCKGYGIQHKKILYSMSKGLVDEICRKIPAYQKIEEILPDIDEFEQLILNKLPIENISENEKNQKAIPKGVIEFSDEIRKIIEKLIVSDYFYNKNYKEIWNMGIDAIIAKIKFSDNENVLTSMSNQGDKKPIFCTKTFLSLKKSMEDSKLVEKLWIARKRERGELNVRYDASNEDYLELLFDYAPRYKEEDLRIVMEMYADYGSKNFGKITNDNKRNVS